MYSLFRAQSHKQATTISWARTGCPIRQAFFKAAFIFYCNTAHELQYRCIDYLSTAAQRNALNLKLKLIINFAAVPHCCSRRRDGKFGHCNLPQRNCGGL